MMIKQTCSNCRFWYQRDGSCRRRAPSAGEHRWPHTRDKDFCGEFEFSPPQEFSDLPGGILRVLHSMNVRNPSELADRTSAELMTSRVLGPVRLGIITKFLAGHGLELRKSGT